MRRFFYCILPFIVIWGGYFSLLFVPQLHHEYLGIVDPSTIKVYTIENRSGNKYYYYYGYVFNYIDEWGKERESKYIHINASVKYRPDGFNVFSQDTWIVKQLYKGKVYAPGWTLWFTIVFGCISFFMFIYLCSFVLEHFNCFLKDNNYNCGRGTECFGCPLCVTDKQTICGIKVKINKSKEHINHFFGYENNS